MQGGPMSVDEKMSARLIELEELVTHLQRTVQDLDGVVLAQQRQLDTLAQRLARLSGQLEANLSARGEPPRTLEDDKPPHY
jgi:uncharacterized coiled-coil protein SlyX